MKIDNLKDGTVVQLRQPSPDDMGHWLRFLRGLSAEDRRYLQVDVTREDVVERLLRESQSGSCYRVLAMAEYQVVGHGALKFSLDGWQRHVGEVRFVVAEALRNKHLGALLLSHLFTQAESLGLQHLIAQMAAPQLGARMLCERLGFRVDTVLPDRVKALDGTLHPLVIMSCSLDEVSRALRDFYDTDNWPDG